MRQPVEFVAGAVIRDAGTRHCRVSRSTAPQVGPRASPDRTAARAVKLIAALTAGRTSDASSTAGTSAYGNARRCSRVFRASELPHQSVRLRRSRPHVRALAQR